MDLAEVSQENAPPCLRPHCSVALQTTTERAAWRARMQVGRVAFELVELLQVSESSISSQQPRPEEAAKVPAWASIWETLPLQMSQNQIVFMEKYGANDK